MQILTDEMRKSLSPKEEKFSNIAHAKAVEVGPTSVTNINARFQMAAMRYKVVNYSKQEAILGCFALHWRGLGHIK